MSTTGARLLILHRDQPVHSTTEPNRVELPDVPPMTLFLRHLQIFRVAAVLAGVAGIAASSLAAQSAAQRPRLTPIEILTRIQAFRVIALGDTTSLNLCPVDEFWGPSGTVINGDRYSTPSLLVTQRDACAALPPTEDWATLSEVRSFGTDSVIVVGTTRRGRIYRLEWYAFLPGALHPTQWRLEYRITMYRDVHPAIDTSGRKLR